jgi:hypothetical protein
MIPLPGSPALCDISPSTATGTDQRGGPRTTTYGATSCQDSGAVQTNYQLSFSIEPPSTVTVNRIMIPPPVVELTESGLIATVPTTLVTMTDGAGDLSVLGTNALNLASGLADFNNIAINTPVSTDNLQASMPLTASINLTATASPLQAEIVGTAATMISPTSGSTLTGSTAAFTWTSGADVTEYNLRVGTTGPGSSNISSGNTTTQGANVSGIPVTGGTLYVRLYSLIDGLWQYSDYTYIEATPASATVISPASGSTLTGTTATFTWTTGLLVSEYDLHVGTTGPGSSNVSWGLTTSQSTNVSGIPATGGTLYVRLYSLINGAWQYNDYTYTEATPAPAVMITPTQGSLLSGSTAAFTWTTGTLVKQYDVHVGTTGPGSSNVSYGVTTTTTTNVSGIPTTGGTLYVRLYSLINGVWQYNDYTYTESGGSGPDAKSYPAAGNGVEKHD